MMELEKIVIYAFEEIIIKYNLQITQVSGNEIHLSSNKYILVFLLHSAELEIVYIEKREDGELYQYNNIRSFILYSISEEDRMQIMERLKNKSEMEIELGLLARTLENKWSELLLGGKKWMKEYQNFILYIPPRNVTKLILQ